MSSRVIDKRFLCVWLDNWPIQRLVVERPELRRQVVVLYTQQGSRGQRVSAASPAARQRGVRIDMPLSEARSIAQPPGAGGSVATGTGPLKTDQAAVAAGAEPASFLLRHDPTADRLELEQLALSCESFSPQIGLEPGPVAECIVMEISTVAHLFAGELGLLNAVRKYFQQCGYWVRVAIAPTLGMAWAAARFANGDPTTATSDSLIIAGESKTIPSSLLPLPTAALRLNGGTVDRLRQLGIVRIEQLLGLSRADLQSRFGDEINHRLDQFRGQSPELIPWLQPAIEFYGQHFLDFPTTDRATIETILFRLIADICRQLQTLQRGALRWELKLYSPQAPTQQIGIDLFQPSARAQHIMPLVKMQLEQHGWKVSGRRRPAVRQNFDAQAFCVHHLSVRVIHSVVLVDRQRLLFDENPRLDRQHLAHLINRLTTRLGGEQVVRARLQADAQAERACFFEPLVNQKARSGTTIPAPRRSRRKPAALPTATDREVAPGRIRSIQHTLPLQRPLRLFEPIELVVELNAQSRPLAIRPAVGTQVHPESHDARHPCDRLFPRRKEIEITRAWGPERIETGWWRGPTIRRDYWRIELRDGRWLWIFRDLRTTQWYCQGKF